MSLIRGNHGGLGGAGAPGGALGSFFSHTLDQSLRFEDGDTANLKRDITSSSNRKTWTWSAWVKRGNLGSEQYLFTDGKSSQLSEFHFDSNDKLRVQLNAGSSKYKLSNQVFRDISAWYHLVWRVDTTQSTAEDRNRVYVNGTQITSWSTEQNVNQNTDSTINESGNDHLLGKYGGNSSRNFDGYMAEVNFIDGTSYGPDTFGETKDGVWVPKEVSGVSYGTNGFYLPFAQDSGSSFFFNRSSPSQVTFTNSSHYDIGSSDDFTIEAFINPTSTILSNYCTLLGYYTTNGPHMMLQFSPSANAFYFYTGNGVGYQFDYTAGDIVAGRWHHFAVNRNSGSLRFFLDGTQKGSTQTDSTAFNNNQFDINIAGDSNYSGSTYSFDGYISNVRMVVGSAVYSDAASLTVPTATLTNVTNTKLLALTTSTFTQDASSNNVTGTVTGSSHFLSGLSPFSNFNFYDDRSGNTNNFAATNLFTSDVVPDSPTNNFATLNALDTYDYTLSEGNLKAVNTTNNRTVRATFLLQSGKWYWEVRRHNTANSDGNISVMVGVTKNGTNVQDNPYNSTGNYTYASHNGVKYTAGSSASYGDNWRAAGDIVGIAFDADAGVVWFSKNGTWQNSATTSEIAAGTTTNAAFTGLTDSAGYIPIFSRTGGSASNELDVNFGQNPSFNTELTGSDVGTESSDPGALFKYAPPTGFEALTTSNMPDITIGPGQSSQADDYFNTVPYTGNGSTRSITGVGFQPDWTWLKSRSNAQGHNVFDSVRGANKALFTNDTNAEFTDTDRLTSFDSDGFSLGADANVNTNNATYVSWNWKAGTSVSGTTSGSGTGQSYTGSVNTTAGFSIIAYTGNGTAGHTIPHHLGVAPKMVISKKRSSTGSWGTYHVGLTSASYYILLNDAAAQGSNNVYFNGTAPTDSVVTRGTGADGNANGVTYIQYAFSEIKGYSKFGKYTGNGNANGTFVFTNMRPAAIFIKNISATAEWVIVDNKRSTFNEVDTILSASEASTEANFGTSNRNLDFVSNGFKIRSTASGGTTALNTSGSTYIYLAFAEAPFKFANAR